MENSTTVYSKAIAGLGRIDIRYMDLEKDLPVIYNWVTQEYAKYWGCNNKSIEQVRAEYEGIISSSHSNAFVGILNGKFSFLCECYDPAKDPVGEHYEALPGDMGMHVLVGPPEKRIPHFTWYVFTTIMDFMFSDSSINRIVVEPDMNNTKIHELNKRAGFEYQRNIQLPNKIASLAFCTRAQYYKALNKENNMKIPQQGIAHLKPELWAKANRLHVAKIISEFAHELLLQPVLQSEENGWGHYSLVPPGKPGIEYLFKAKKLSLNHWYIDKQTVTKRIDRKTTDLDSLYFILEFSDGLNISKEQLPGYMEEIASTLYGSTYMLSKKSLTAKELAQADYQTFEHAMTSGHPCFVANNGRIGFDSDDYQEFAPEADQAIQLIWLAGHKSHTSYSAIDELSYQTLLEKELDPQTLSLFNQIIEKKGLSPKDYFFIPVHPWQWYNKLSIIFAPDIAANNLLCLGYGPDEFKPQQSIRTFYNISNPEKFYTKTALSVLNMGFVRGLTPYYMDSTPPITNWIKQAIGEDPYIKQLGFTLLCEVATVGYRNFYYEEFGRNSAYNKMLAALWRESPATVLAPGQQLMTMAALLHVDNNGDALLPALIAASGKSTSVWLQQYLQCYLTPLLHCFYQHDLVFMPHGENLILVMEGNIPVKAIMKDITEEIAVFNTELELPEKARRICVDVPEELRILSLFIDVFDCFFRFLTEILEEHCDYSDEQFWELVAACIQDYQQDHPQLAEKFEQYDLFAPEFTLSCLNRLQLRNNKQMVDLADPAGSLQLAGTLKNPVAVYKPTPIH
ncbi:Siderophore synthetase component [Chitinophaga sp. CF118]|uniref:GNAT family N-acetyltransferase n=1 Tax=Chitinophaga sp. CF118 TaxID=1884367 RepID=UPI0008DFF642|nr:GNAT family N-acetyltransferase [Chitinophaga sp. CF118]SFD62468.1 Siderophore synthetase component [Chitinophaga sp. CF118]